MTCRISMPTKKLKGTICLTASKSEHNRVLIIRALCKHFFEIENPAAAKDTQTLQETLSTKEKEINVGPAGTTMRFLTALFAVTPGIHIITGSERMKQRPIGILVDALRELGASIEYLENEGYPPLKVEGKELAGEALAIDGSISSQYISALLLIAPSLHNGLKLHLKGELTSVPYIQMTLKVMERFGIKYSWTNNVISVPRQEYYCNAPYRVEADWSAASYYYSMSALADEVDLVLMGLEKNSLQGDAVIAEIYASFGVITEFIEGGIRLSKSGRQVKEFSHDFSSCPDIAQTVAVTAAALRIPAKLSGLHTLRIKETDRIAALQKELQKLGVQVEVADSSLTIIPADQSMVSDLIIATYEDHRMAMSFAPLALSAEVEIEDARVVEKSYPGFWNDLRALGFNVEMLE